MYTVFSIIVTMFCIRSLDLIHIIAESLYPLTTLSLFSPSLATTFPFYEFDFFLLRCCVKVMGFPGGASGKEPISQCRRHRRCRFDPWLGKIRWRKEWQPTPVFLPGEPYEQSLVGYSPWGCKESDTTEVT